MKFKRRLSARPPPLFSCQSRYLSIGMRSPLLTETGTMPPQVCRPGARVSKAHPTEVDTLQPGQERRKKRRILGTITAPVEGDTGGAFPSDDDGSTGFGSLSGPDKMMHHDYGAGRHCSSPLGCASAVARRRPREDAGEEEGDDGKPRIPMLKISAVVSITGMMPSTKRAMTMPRDLILPPVRDSDFGMIKLQYYDWRGRLKPAKVSP